MKKKGGGGGGGANWMDTYGDMVTLLLCFFVLLYSMSTISEEKWKALVKSFNPDAEETLYEPGLTSEDQSSMLMSDLEDSSSLEGELTQEEIDQAIEDIYQALKDYVESQGIQDAISVTKGDGKVFVTFSNTVFFDGDRAELRAESRPVLDVISEMFTSAKDSIDEVRILGHTAQAIPTRPNDPQGDRTLASQRATNVLVYIQERTELDPARLISEGLGQWRPVADNDTEEGRAKNRRVEMIVSGRNLEQELSSAIQQYSTTSE